MWAIPHVHTVARCSTVNRYVISVGWDRRINIYYDSLSDSNIHHVQHPVPYWADDEVQHAVGQHANIQIGWLWYETTDKTHINTMSDLIGWLWYETTDKTHINTMADQIGWLWYETTDKTHINTMADQIGWLWYETTDKTHINTMADQIGWLWYETTDKTHINTMADLKRQIEHTHGYCDFDVRWVAVHCWLNLGVYLMFYFVVLTFQATVWSSHPLPPAPTPVVKSSQCWRWRCNRREGRTKKELHSK